ncbi:uncharacterized protein KY384_004688 [Bacidia gigantensis]|uniref:uncharacterized protein n=1 Tax=Bacidia gigantensis TaxID=2732470 RepID=UPI001D04B061|nr:uncharacterized protein KY384_004688 [Bacidia gigantensis]KAG8530188.1 hypothetical protein KY384_004688 [Bacidia gigantensis]
MITSRFAAAIFVLSLASNVACVGASSSLQQALDNDTQTEPPALHTATLTIEQTCNAIYGAPGVALIQTEIGNAIAIITAASTAFRATPDTALSGPYGQAFMPFNSFWFPKLPGITDARGYVAEYYARMARATRPGSVDEHGDPIKALLISCDPGHFNKDGSKECNEQFAVTREDLNRITLCPPWFTDQIQAPPTTAITCRNGAVLESYNSKDVQGYKYGDKDFILTIAYGVQICYDLAQGYFKPKSGLGDTNAPWEAVLNADNWTWLAEVIAELITLSG